MIEKLYGKYFQKSRSFLFPALGIKRTTENAPAGTYISIEGDIGPEEMKLICTFRKNDSKDFKTFEERMLLTNPLFIKKLESKTYDIYIFDLEIYKHDYFSFLLGKYSNFSNVLKKAIKSYYNEKSAEYAYIDTYLYPEKYFEKYAEILQVDIEVLEKIGQLCDPCDLEKETLVLPKEYLEELKKSI